MDSDFDPFAGFPPLPPQPPPPGGCSSAAWTEVSQQQQQQEEESAHAVQGMSAALREWCASELRRLGHAEALPLAEYCHGLPGAEEARELFRDNLGRGRPAVDAFVEAFLARREVVPHHFCDSFDYFTLPEEASSIELPTSGCQISVPAQAASQSTAERDPIDPFSCFDEPKTGLCPTVLRADDLRGAELDPSAEHGGMPAALREWCASELRRLGHSEALPLAEYCHGLPGAEEARELFRDNLGRGRPAVDAFVEAFLVRRTFAHSVSEDLLLLMLPDEEECRDQSERSPWGSAVGGCTTKVVDPFEIFISPCNGQGSNDCVSDVVSCSAPTDASTRNTWQQGPAVEAGAWDPFSSIDAPAADDPFAGFSVPSAQPVCQGAVRTAVQPAPQQPRHSPAHIASVKGTAGGNKGECVVCMARDVNATFVHVESGMGHSACCLQCAQALLSSGAPCPMCRMPITMVIRNYSS